MNGLILSLKPKCTMRLDMSPITPHNLHKKNHVAIQKIKLNSGRQTIALGELFTVRGRANNDVLTIRQAHDKLDFIGHGMTNGTIRVSGSAGDYLGKNMQGGQIVVTRNIGVWGGAGMRDGYIEIRGDTKDYLGGALPGQSQGMAGGMIVVHGNAGARLGDGLRRGIIAVKGQSGDYVGSRMVAGTIVLLGRTGVQLGFQMRRGTIITVEKPKALPVTFNHCGTFDLGVTRLIFNYLRQFDKHFKPLAEQLYPVEKWVGDLAIGGKGELLRLLNYET